jgi:hypothetical protein
MQYHRRRIRLLRRFVLGLAVAAIVAPAAQARIPDADTSVLRGALPNGLIVQGEPKSDLGDGVVLRRTAPDGTLVQGERKTDLPQARYVPFVSDFPRTAPAPGGDNASPLGYRRALPQDYGVVPVEAVRGPSTFDWGDALIGAGGALVLLLLAGGAAVATRHVRRPAAA